MAVTWDQLPLPFDEVLSSVCRLSRSRFDTFPCCPQCDGDLQPEHAHFRCVSCGWRDSCCD
ncbi:MAG: hypothetical protein QOJ67_4212 [Acidimicrobiaceae bacterium]|jgi:hypothetical protein